MRRKYIFLFMMLFAGVANLCAANDVDSIGIVGEGKFVTIPIESIDDNGTTPVYTTQINVGANYANTKFTVKAEYPEYERVNAQESELLAKSKADISEEIKVNCNPTIERKQGVLDISFYPYVKRNGVYYRLKTCKLAVYRNVVTASRSTRRLRHKRPICLSLRSRHRQMGENTRGKGRSLPVDQIISFVSGFLQSRQGETLRLRRTCARFRDNLFGRQQEL